MHGSLSKQNMQESTIKKKIANYLIFNRIIRGATSLIYLNEQEYNNSTVNSVNPNHIIIPNGCFIPSKDEISLNDSDSKTEIIFLGRISRIHKGLDFLVDGLRILSTYKESRNIHCSIYGSGTEAEVNWLKKEASTLGNLVNIHSAIYGDEKNTVFKNADIFILTSRYEGFPMAILEALSYGIPCIVSPTTNVSDIIENNDCGWVTSLNPQEIASTILKAHHDNLQRKSQLQMSAINTAKKYNWSSIAKLSIDKDCDALGRV